MGLRFRKNINLLPGIRLNLSKGGASVSVGRKGATINLGRKGARATIGAPGSGFSYSQEASSRKGGISKLFLLICVIVIGVWIVNTYFIG